MTLPLIGVVLLALACGCERADPVAPPDPWRPFTPTTWTSFPTDDAILSAMVGTGGTAAERLEFRDLARDYLLATEKASARHGEFEWISVGLRGWRQDWETEVRDGNVMKFVVSIVIGYEANRIMFEASDLAHGRAHLELWPDEPYPDWVSPDVGVAEIARRAELLRAELEVLRQRTERHVPEAFLPYPAGDTDTIHYANWFVRSALDNLRVASGGGYDRCNNGLEDDLARHGIKATATPEY